MKTKFNTRVLTGTAMLAAVATVLMYMEFPIPIMPAFIKLDVSELPALIASFAYGPVAGIVVCLIKNLIKLPSTSTAAVGELFNFVMGALFVGVAGMVYRFKKTRSGAILGAVLGALVMAIVSVPYNYFIVYPAYVVMYHLPLDAIIGMYQAINPNCQWPFELPAGVQSAVHFLQRDAGRRNLLCNLQAAFAHSAWPQQRWQKRNRLIAADWAAIIGHFYPF